MNQADVYHRGNQMQRKDAEKIIEEEPLRWRLDGHDTLLDIGCGSGDVLMDFIYPQLPKDFSLVVGSDISTKMIEYARNNYTKDERVQFRVLDIESDVLPKDLCEKFDHVTSFYCLHWVQNQRRAFQNIHRLLRPEHSDCLVVFLASAPIFDVYKAFSEMPKWAAYMKDVDSYMSPLQYSEDPVQEVRNMLIESGFVDFKVEVRNCVHPFKNAESLKSSVKAVCPFMDRFSITQQEEFLEEFLKSLENTEYCEFDPDTQKFVYTSIYKLLVVYARKSRDYFTSTIETERIVKGLN